MKKRNKIIWRRKYTNRERKSTERVKEEETLINLFVGRLRTLSVP
jgi:hypothetical protein